MTFPTFLFVAIDKLFDGGQNKKKMLRFKDVKFEIETDIPYTEGEYCKLDTYYVKKDNDEKYPVFFYIHGGGFVAGDKYHRRGMAKWAAEKGFFVVNVNYGLGPKELFPLGLQHLITALNWVGQNAEKYNLDLDNMCVSGDSAGGYYSAMLGCVCSNKELQQRFGVQTSLKFRSSSRTRFAATSRAFTQRTSRRTSGRTCFLRSNSLTQASRPASSRMPKRICSARDKVKSLSLNLKNSVSTLNLTIPQSSSTTTAIRSTGIRVRLSRTSNLWTTS